MSCADHDAAAHGGGVDARKKGQGGEEAEDGIIQASHSANGCRPSHAS